MLICYCINAYLLLHRCLFLTASILEDNVQRCRLWHLCYEAYGNICWSGVFLHKFWKKNTCQKSLHQVLGKDITHQIWKAYSKKQAKTVKGLKLDEKGLTKHYSRPLRADVAFVYGLVKIEKSFGCMDVFY